MTQVAARTPTVEERADDARRSLVHVLRAGGVVLLVAGQTWLLYPFEGLERWRPLSGFLRAGNLGVSILLVCSGFVVARAMLAAAGPRPRAALRVLLRHFVPVVAALVLALLFVAAVTLLDSSDPWTSEVTRVSVEQVLGFNWNHYIAAHPLAVRGDLAGLWYFSVEAQTLPLVVLAIAALRRWPRLLVVLVGAALVAAHTGQVLLSQREDWFQLGLWTITRADSVLWGMLAALVVHLVQVRGAAARVAVPATQLTGAVMVLYVALPVAQDYVSPLSMFRGMDAVTGLVTAVALASASLADRRATVFRLEGITVLDDLGRVWVYAVALVGPYLFTLSRNTASWSPGSRLALGLVGFVLVLYVVDQVLLPIVSAVTDKLSGRLNA